MKPIRILISVMLAILFSVVSVSAVVTDEDLRNNTQTYISYDNDNLSSGNPLDLTPNNNDGTNNGATTGVSGIIEEAFDFDGSDYVQLPYSQSSSFTWYSWVYADNLGGAKAADMIMSQAPTRFRDALYFNHLNNEWVFILADSADVVVNELESNMNNQWRLVVGRYDGTEARLDVWDDTCTNIGNGTNTLTYTNSNNNMYVGVSGDVATEGQSRNWEGKIDETTVWEEYKTTDELQELCDRQSQNLSGAQYPFSAEPPASLSFQNITVNNEEIINDSIFNTSSLNFSVDVLNSTTNGNVNQTYNLYYNNGTQINSSQYATNNVNGSFSINLSNGRYKINFFAENNESSVKSQNYSIRIDIDPPELIVSIPHEINTYDLNLTEEINFSSTGQASIDTCEVTFNYTFNSSQQITPCQNETFSFDYNGIWTYDIFVNDTAGNFNTDNGSIFVNPEFVVDFTDENGTDIDNFAINGTDYTEDFRENIYDYGLGTTEFEFVKTGFDTTRFNLTFNRSSTINETYVVPPAEIFFEFVNVDTGDFIENENTTTVEIIGEQYSTKFTTTARNYTLNDLDIVPDTYTVLVSNPNYDTVSTSFTFANQDRLELPIYMTPEGLQNVADLIVEVQDQQGNRQSNINTQQSIWDSDKLEYVKINEKETDYRGQTSYKVFLETRSYKFCAEYEGELFCQSDVVVNVNTDKVILPINTNILNDTEPTKIYDVDFSYSLTNETQPNNTSLVEFTWDNLKQNVDEYCLTVFRLDEGQRTEVFADCSTSHSAGLSTYVNLNTNKTYIAEASIKVDGEERVLETLRLNYDNILQNSLEKYGLHKLLALVFLAFGIGIGLSRPVRKTLVSLVGIMLAYLITALLFPDLIPFDIFIIIALVCGITIRYITKRDDIGDKPKVRNLLMVVATYVVMIFTLTFVLADLDDKGMLDSYGENLYGYLSGQNGELNSLEQYINQTESQLESQKASSSPAGEDKIDNTLTTFIKLLGWVNTFFAILSKIFTIPQTLYVMLGYTSPFLTTLFSYINWIVNLILFKVFYDALFRK